MERFAIRVLILMKEYGIKTITPLSMDAIMDSENGVVTKYDFQGDEEKMG